MLRELKDLLGFDGTFDSYETVLLPTTRGRVEFVAGKGSKVKVRKDGEEKWVVDGTSQVGTNPFGHRNPEMMDAMQEFWASDIPMMIAGEDGYHPLQRELAEAFTDIYPGNLSAGDLKTYYCNSGSEAVERGCLKAAQLCQGGNTYVAFRNAFHGRTSLAVSCNFSKGPHTEGYNSLFRVFPVQFATPDMDVDTVLEDIQRLLVQEGPRNVNAVIVEPIQGEGGYNIPHEDFLPGIRDITRDYDIPLVMDEVQSSLRTGHWFACENWDVEPDMISVAKAFSGGITPFGASLIKDEFATEDEGKLSGTFGGNPKECYAALKTIELIQEHDYLSHVRSEGDHFESAWHDLVTQEAVVDVRGRGVMWGVEFATVEQRDTVLDRLFHEHDIITEGCGHDQFNPSIRFLLPMNVEHEVVSHVADALTECVNSLDA